MTPKTNFNWNNNFSNEKHIQFDAFKNLTNNGFKRAQDIPDYVNLKYVVEFRFSYTKPSDCKIKGQLIRFVKFDSIKKRRNYKAFWSQRVLHFETLLPTKPSLP